MRRRTTILAGVIAVVASMGWCEPTRWLNVEVNEPAKDTEVRLHLPVSLVTAVLASVDSEGLRHGKVTVCTVGHEVDWTAVLAAVRTAQEGLYVTVKDRDADVRVRKISGQVEVDVDEHGERGDHVRLRLPVELIDALKLDGDTLDVADFVARLGKVSGELLRVTSRDANVRIWVE
jgi:hypothetical protein